MQLVDPENVMRRTTTLVELRSALASIAPEAWLSDDECQQADSLRDQGRRQQWLAGRYLAKQLISEHLEEVGGQRSEVGDQVNLKSEIINLKSLRSLYIQSHDGTRRATRPRIFIDGRLQAWSLSISHTDRLVSAALATRPGLSVGVDLAAAQPLAANVVRMWFTAAERRWLDSAGGTWCPQQLWAAKEATFKAASRGERFVPRQLEIYGDADQRLVCRWRNTDLTTAWHLHVERIEGHHFVLATVSTGSLTERQPPTTNNQQLATSYQLPATNYQH